MPKKTENEQTRLFCKIFVIDGIAIEGARAPWLSVWCPGTPWLLATPMVLRQDRVLKFLHKKKHLQQNLKNFFFQNVENSSQVT